MAAQIQIRVYKGRTQQDAAKEYQHDANALAAGGWEVVTQSWADGRSGCLRFILLGGIGALVIKPKGTLTVTYRLAPPPPPPVAPSV